MDTFLSEEMLLPALLILQIGRVLACMATRNTASATPVLCTSVTVLPITNPTNNDVEPTITYSGSAATVVCEPEVTGLVSTVQYNTNVNSMLSTITLICVGEDWTYTPTGGTSTVIENVQCLTT